MTSNGYDFQMPSFSVSKLETLADNAVRLLEEFRTLLLSLGVETGNPALVEGYRYDGMDGTSVGYRLSILSNTDNLLRFLGRVGYLYNQEKQRIASLATCFLTHVQAIRDQRNQVRQQAVALKAAGVTAAKIIETLSSDVAGPSFIRHSIWQTRGGARLWRSTKFEEFAETFEEEKSGLVYDRVVSIESVPYEGLVHDVTIGDANHNFVADGVVVSNCGMRLVRTNLRYSEVKPRVKELVDLLFRLVPTGVGVKGSVRLNQSQFEEVMRWGVKWCAENGLGWADDVEKVEEGGSSRCGPFQGQQAGLEPRHKPARDPRLGEPLLRDTGRRPSEVLRPEDGRKFGLVHDDQVVVMVHCGSRGFGHQVGSDYLRMFDEAMKRYQITVQRQRARLRPLRLEGGRGLLRRDGLRGGLAFANRQIIVQRIREAFQQVFHKDPESVDMQIIYDVCHNIAKVERHTVDGGSVGDPSCTGRGRRGASVRGT